MIKVFIVLMVKFYLNNLNKCLKEVNLPQYCHLLKHLKPIIQTTINSKNHGLSFYLTFFSQEFVHQLTHMKNLISAGCYDLGKQTKQIEKKVKKNSLKIFHERFSLQTLKNYMNLLLNL